MLYISGFPKNLDVNNPARMNLAITNSIIGLDKPKEPFLTTSSKIASLGSCFAEEIANALKTRGHDIIYFFMSERWNSAFAVDVFLAHVIDETPLPSGFISNIDKLEEMTQENREKFRAADLFIITFGMSLCWFDANKQLVVEPGKTHTKEGLASSVKNFAMIQTSVEQNEEAILRCIHRIKRFKPNAEIVITLSPVPMLGTVYETSVVQANTVSKAVLRIAIENVRRKQIDGVRYWPSYEIVNWYGNHVHRSFGDDDRDERHVRADVINLITDQFVKNYVQPAAAEQTSTPA
ncbi:MAG: GSCFA domain-containing protein [Rhodospirillaceae bacterium]|nr:GSCFA domain-containing protein [Rhodospirillaceae bacterium]